MRKWVVRAALGFVLVLVLAAVAVAVLPRFFVGCPPVPGVSYFTIGCQARWRGIDGSRASAAMSRIEQYWQSLGLNPSAASRSSTWADARSFSTAAKSSPWSASPKRLHSPVVRRVSSAHSGARRYVHPRPAGRPVRPSGCPAPGLVHARAVDLDQPRSTAGSAPGLATSLRNCLLKAG